MSMADDVRKPTHYCVICAARWVEWAGGSWSMVSAECGPCCDNVPMSDAPIVPFRDDGTISSDDCDRVKRRYRQLYRRELAKRGIEIGGAK